MEQEHELQAAMPAAYHVFINHRGPDVKNSLASLIYHRLANVHKMRVFLDKNEIHTGENISDAIRTAIQNASVHITIFSLHYAESSWCLEELCSILSSYDKHNRTVIPVFYDVEPTDLRHIERGCYKIAFEEHQLKGRVSMEVMENWKKALIKASQLSGLLFKTKESDQGEMLEKIVGIVLKKVLKWGSLEVAKYPVGLEQAAEDFPINEIMKQNESSESMIVVIAGMSGAGKSTLARYLYNMRHLDFNGRSCFLSKVRQNDLLLLQGKLLRNLGVQWRHMLRGCRILLVLDDVDSIDQIDDLIDLHSVGRGSLILITSPDKGLLTRTSPKTLVYQVKPLNRQQGRELFCQHAFRQSRPSEGFEGLVEEFLEICKGLPLSLKVLGGHFVGRPDREYWKRQLVRFSATLHQDIESVLRVSYDALNIEEKEAFLDIGCFLVGEETELAIRVLNGLYGSDIVHYLETLHQKCFLEFHYDVLSDDEFECRKQEKPVMGYNDLSLEYRGYKLTMHDQLRQLARVIGCAETPHERVLDDTVLNKLRVRAQIYNISPPDEFQLIRGIRLSKDDGGGLRGGEGGSGGTSSPSPPPKDDHQGKEVSGGVVGSSSGDVDDGEERVVNSSSTVNTMRIQAQQHTTEYREVNSYHYNDNPDHYSYGHGYDYGHGHGYGYGYDGAPQNPYPASYPYPYNPNEEPATSAGASAEYPSNYFSDENANGCSVM